MQKKNNFFQRGALLSRSVAKPGLFNRRSPARMGATGRMVGDRRPAPIRSSRSRIWLSAEGERRGIAAVRMKLFCCRQAKSNTDLMAAMSHKGLLSRRQRKKGIERTHTLGKDRVKQADQERHQKALYYRQIKKLSIWETADATRYSPSQICRIQALTGTQK